MVRTDRRPGRCRARTFPDRALDAAVHLLLFACIAASLGCGDECASCPDPLAWEWPTASPASQGLDEGLLAELTAELAAGRLGPVSSALIVRDGQLVYEEYFLGQDPDNGHPVYSITKSVTSALIGIAREEGAISNLDTPLLEYFPQYTNLEHDTPEKRAITLEHALQMRTGIEWDERSSNYSSPANPVYHLYRSPDWFRFVLDRPMQAAPGTVFTYNTGVTTLLSGVLERAAGMTAEQYARTRLFRPIGIHQYSWNAGPGGITDTGGGLRLRPRDMARFGYLYLNRGVWEPTGEAIVPAAWVDVSLERHTAFGSGGGYGYQWWVTRTESGGSELPYAAGWGGQRIYIVPSLDMVIVLTAENFAQQPSFHGEILWSYILPAAGAGASAVEPATAHTDSAARVPG